MQNSVLGRPLSMEDEAVKMDGSNTPFLAAA